jgi:hypothetical protein
LQEEAHKLLHKTGGSPLLIRVVAGLLREPNVQGQGPDDVDKWRSIVKGLERLIRNNQDVYMNGFTRPMLVYELSVQSMGEQEKQLLAVLAHFPPVQDVPVAVVKSVWQGMWSGEESLFDMLLQRLQRMNVVDVHEGNYHGSTYGESTLSFDSVHILECPVFYQASQSFQSEVLT